MFANKVARLCGRSWRFYTGWGHATLGRDGVPLGGEPGCREQKPVSSLVPRIQLSRRESPSGLSFPGFRSDVRLPGLARRQGGPGSAQEAVLHREGGAQRRPLREGRAHLLEKPLSLPGWPPLNQRQAQAGRLQTPAPQDGSAGASPREQVRARETELPN